MWLQIWLPSINTLTSDLTFQQAHHSHKSPYRCTKITILNTLITNLYTNVNLPAWLFTTLKNTGLIPIFLQFLINIVGAIHHKHRKNLESQTLATHHKHRRTTHHKHRTLGTKYGDSSQASQFLLGIPTLATHHKHRGYKITSSDLPQAALGKIGIVQTYLTHHKSQGFLVGFQRAVCVYLCICTHIVHNIHYHTTKSSQVTPT